MPQSPHPSFRFLTFMGSLAVNLGTTLVTAWANRDTIDRMRWVFFAVILLAVIVMWLTAPGKTWSRRHNGRTPLVRIVAGLLFVTFIALSWWLSTVPSPSISLTFATITAMWLAVVLLSWNSLRNRVDPWEAALGVAFSLLGVATLLLGIAHIRDEPLPGIATLLSSLAFLLSSVWLIRGMDLLLKAQLLLLGVASMLFSVAFLREGFMLAGFAMLVAGFSFALLARLGGPRLLGSAMLLVGVASMLFGVAFLHAAPLFGASILLVGVGSMLAGVAHLRDRLLLTGIASLLYGVAGLLLGASLLGQGTMLLGIASLIASFPLLSVLPALLIAKRTGSLDQITSLASRAWARLNRRDGA